MASKIMRVVRNVTGYNGYIYNDRLQGGVRSIKIGLGFNVTLTDAVAAALVAEGYTVRKVKGFKLWEMDTYRLHVS